MATAKKTVRKAPVPRINGKEVVQFCTREYARKYARMFNKRVYDLDIYAFTWKSNKQVNQALRWFCFV